MERPTDWKGLVQRPQHVSNFGALNTPNSNQFPTNIDHPFHTCSYHFQVFLLRESSTLRHMPMCCLQALFQHWWPWASQISVVLYTSTIGTMYRSHVSPGAQGHIFSSFAIDTFPVSFVGIFHFCVFVLLVVIHHPLCWQNQPTDRKPRFSTIKYCNLRPALTRLAVARYSNYPFDSPIFSSLSVAVFTQKSVPLAPKEMKRRSWHRSFDMSTRSSSQSPSPFFLRTGADMPSRDYALQRPAKSTEVHCWFTLRDLLIFDFFSDLLNKYGSNSSELVSIQKKNSFKHF